MATLATYKVEVGWEAVAANAFTFGVSTLDGGGVLGSQLYTDFGGTHDDISSDVQGFDVRRGRGDNLSGTPMGEAVVRLTDTTGKYNPRNASSPLAGTLLAMRPVRIRATYGGTTYGVFRGYVRTIEYDPVAKVATLMAGDLFLWLSRVYPTIASVATTTGGAIGLLLDAIGLTEPALRSVDPLAGDPITFSADGSQSALSLIEDLLTAERGVFFIDGDGVAVYLDRTVLQGNVASVATIDASIAVVPNVEVERIRNRVSVTAEGGNAQVAYDADSQATYGWADIPAISSAFLADDLQAARLANYLMALYRDAVGNIRSLRLVNGSPANVTHMLARRLQDRVTVSDPAVGGADYIIEGVALSLSGVTLTWEATLSECSGNGFFIFGSSLMDGGDVLGY